MAEDKAIKKQRVARIGFRVLGPVFLLMVIPTALLHDWFNVLLQGTLGILTTLWSIQCTNNIEIATRNNELQKLVDRQNKELQKYRSRERDVEIAKMERELGIGKWQNE